MWKENEEISLRREKEVKGSPTATPSRTPTVTTLFNSKNTSFINPTKTSLLEKNQRTDVSDSLEEQPIIVKEINPSSSVLHGPTMNKPSASREKNKLPCCAAVNELPTEETRKLKHHIRLKSCGWPEDTEETHTLNAEEEESSPVQSPVQFTPPAFDNSLKYLEENSVSLFSRSSHLLKPFPKYFERRKSSIVKTWSLLANSNLLEDCCARVQIPIDKAERVSHFCLWL
ncbi:uncharacterized protein LOC120069082 isoform X2 [Benincasa hispida]|uniref:uncharacterized protein LOC120069082 isoform X2 n=1 Tax=Benincasa hispida TaxID=102211 RepID=UPI0019007F61|nr:uncharacterized protein LOC120069082 isoform X2 [Benincasa hispida]